MVAEVRHNSKKHHKWRIIGNRLYKQTNIKHIPLGDQEDYWKEVIPKEERIKVIQKNHDHPTAGHCGISKTLSRIKQQYYWPKMKADIKRYVNRCKTCIQVKPEQKQPAGYMLPQSITDRPWKIVSTDLIGPLPTSKHGNKYILVVLDVFSKFPLIFPLRNALAHNIVKLFVDNVIMFFGAPKTIECDNGVQFRSSLFKKNVYRLWY